MTTPTKNQKKIYKKNPKCLFNKRIRVLTLYLIILTTVHCNQGQIINQENPEQTQVYGGESQTQIELQQKQVDGGESHPQIELQQNQDDGGESQEQIPLKQTDKKNTQEEKFKENKNDKKIITISESNIKLDFNIQKKAGSVQNLDLPVLDKTSETVKESVSENDYANKKESEVFTDKGANNVNEVDNKDNQADLGKKKNVTENKSDTQDQNNYKILDLKTQNPLKADITRAEQNLLDTTSNKSGSLKKQHNGNKELAKENQNKLEVRVQQVEGNVTIEKGKKNDTPKTQLEVGGIASDNQIITENSIVKKNDMPNIIIPKVPDSIPDKVLDSNSTEMNKAEGSSKVDLAKNQEDNTVQTANKGEENYNNTEELEDVDNNSSKKITQKPQSLSEEKKISVNEIEKNSQVISSIMSEDFDTNENKNGENRSGEMQNLLPKCKSIIRRQHVQNFDKKSINGIDKPKKTNESKNDLKNDKNNIKRNIIISVISSIIFIIIVLICYKNCKGSEANEEETKMKNN